ncbi:MAG: 50S ribosomal protein L10 [Gaiellaceae bacterium]|jgi:large subunit ribosomal protein L10
MLKTDKEHVVAELASRLKETETVIVTDYRGLTTTELADLRAQLRKHGARFSVVKNTLAKRAAEKAGATTLLELFEGPTAIAFLESDGDPIGVAKVLRDTAKTTKILSVRGGVLQGSQILAEQIEDLAKLPPAEVLRAQLVGTIAAAPSAIVGLFTAPMRDFVGVLDARIKQLESQ